MQCVSSFITIDSIAIFFINVPIQPNVHRARLCVSSTTSVSYEETVEHGARIRETFQRDFEPLEDARQSGEHNGYGYPGIEGVRKSRACFAFALSASKQCCDKYAAIDASFLAWRLDISRLEDRILFLHEFRNFVHFHLKIISNFIVLFAD